jgi:hypothetical protein
MAIIPEPATTRNGTVVHGNQPSDILTLVEDHGYAFLQEINPPFTVVYRWPVVDGDARLLVDARAAAGMAGYAVTAFRRTRSGWTLTGTRRAGGVR